MSIAKLKKEYLKIKSSKKLSEGLLSVNGKYYFSTFKETDKYNEDRYFFQSFDMDNFLKKLSEDKNTKFKDYIEKFKLEVIEDSTYTIEQIKIRKIK